jgi:hypothetical protein
VNGDAPAGASLDTVTLALLVAEIPEKAGVRIVAAKANTPRVAANSARVKPRLLRDLNIFNFPYLIILKLKLSLSTKLNHNIGLYFIYSYTVF